MCSARSKRGNTSCFYAASKRPSMSPVFGILSCCLHRDPMMLYCDTLMSIEGVPMDNQESVCCAKYLLGKGQHLVQEEALVESRVANHLEQYS